MFKLTGAFSILAWILSFTSISMGDEDHPYYIDHPYIIHVYSGVLQEETSDPVSIMHAPFIFDKWPILSTDVRLAGTATDIVNNNIYYEYPENYPCGYESHLEHYFGLGAPIIGQVDIDVLDITGCEGDIIDLNTTSILHDYGQVASVYIKGEGALDWSCRIFSMFFTNIPCDVTFSHNITYDIFLIVDLDLNRDNFVNFDDLLLLLSNWGSPYIDHELLEAFLLEYGNDG